MRVAVAVFFTVALASQVARGDGETGIVIVQADDAKPAEIKTIEAIREQVGDLPVTVYIERHARFADLRAQMDYATAVAASRHARGVFWVDADALGDTLLFLFEPEGSQLLLRRVEHGGNVEALTEEVANVAHSIVDALVEGRHVGMTTVSLPTPQPRTPPIHVPVVHAAPPQRSATWAVLDSNVGFATETLAGSAPWTLGTAISIGCSFRQGVLVRAEYDYFFPTTVSGDTAVIRLARHPIEVAVALEGHFGRFRLGAEIGAVTDAVTRATVTTSLGLVGTPSSTSWAFAVAPRVRATWQMLPWAGLYGRVGLDAFVTKTTYAIGDAAFFTPDLARLRLDVGLELFAPLRRD